MHAAKKQNQYGMYDIIVVIIYEESLICIKCFYIWFLIAYFFADGMTHHEHWTISDQSTLFVLTFNLFSLIFSKSSFVSVQGFNSNKKKLSFW